MKLNLFIQRVFQSGPEVWSAVRTFCAYRSILDPRPKSAQSITHEVPLRVEEVEVVPMFQTVEMF